MSKAYGVIHEVIIKLAISTFQLFKERATFMFRIFLKLHFFPCIWTLWFCMQWLQQQKSNPYNIRLFSLKPLHCKEIFFSKDFLLKMASVKLAKVTSSIKGFHVYRRSPDSKVKCVSKETNRHSNTAIKVVGDANETIGLVPDWLSKLVAPALKKEIVLSVEAEVTGYPRDAAEGKLTLGGGIEVPCIYRFMVPKRAKPKLERN